MQNTKRNKKNQDLKNYLSSDIRKKQTDKRFEMWEAEIIKLNFASKVKVILLIRKRNSVSIPIFLLLNKHFLQQI